MMFTNVMHKCHFSKWHITWPQEHKSADEVVHGLKTNVFIFGLPRILQSDNGGEFTSQSFQEWMSERGIRAETSAPHTPEQNGVSERANRTIVEGARCLLHAKHLPLELWGEAISCAVYTLNRVTSKATPNTPFQSWYGTKPNVSNLRIFGSTAYIHIPKAERRKLDSKSLKCYFVGYCNTQKAYRFWEPISRKIKTSRDVIFDERTIYTPETSLSPSIDDPLKHLICNSSLQVPPTTEIIEQQLITPEENAEIETDVSPSTTNTNQYQEDSSISSLVPDKIPDAIKSVYLPTHYAYVSQSFNEKK